MSTSSVLFNILQSLNTMQSLLRPSSRLLRTYKESKAPPSFHTVPKTSPRLSPAFYTLVQQRLQSTMSPNLARPHEGRLAIVTGGSRGIGAAIAQNLAAKGSNLILNYTSSSSTSKTESLCTSLSTNHGVRAYPAQVDMGSPSCGSDLISHAKKNFGEDCTIHIIVNNAGIAQHELIEDQTVENFHKQYDINVLGPLLLFQAVLPHLPHDRSARIVNLSSVSAALGFTNQSVYGGTKAALEAMTRSWARIIAENGTVNAVNPGPVDTDMYGGVTEEFEKVMTGWLSNTPGANVTKEKDGEEIVRKYGDKGGRPATAEEIAGVVGMLCSNESGWCTGSVICANGGMRMSP